MCIYDRVGSGGGNNNDSGGSSSDDDPSSGIASLLATPLSESKVDARLGAMSMSIVATLGDTHTPFGKRNLGHGHGADGGDHHYHHHLPIPIDSVMSDPHFIQQYASHRISPSTADHPYDAHPINGHPSQQQQQQQQLQQQHHPHPLKNTNGHSRDHLNYDSGTGSGYKSSESSGYLPTPTSAQLHHQIYQHSQYYPSSHPAQHHASQDAKIYDPTLGPGPSRRQASQGVMTPVSPARSVEEEFADGRVGVEDPCESGRPSVHHHQWSLADFADGERSYSELKCLGDGSFGTVWLCDWHSHVKSNVLLSAMQCGAGARDEWSGKRLVALKRMKRVWEGGWKQASTLGELVVSRL